MRNILEKAFVALLNAEHDKAEELFHKFIVARAQQIHESIRHGEDYELEENWDEEVTTESYFTEEDLDSLEGGEEGDEETFGDEDAFGEPAADDDMSAGEAEDDLSGDLTGEEPVDGEEPEFGAEPAEELPVEDRIEELEDQFEKLTAEFEDMMAGLGSAFDDEEEGEPEMDDTLGEPEADTDDAMDTDTLGDGDDLSGETSFGDEAPEDDMEDDQPMESADEEDFDEITESIIDELEKVTVTLDDGKEIGTGKGFTQNKGASLPQKNKDARQGGEPVKIKSSKHTGFARETAPQVDDMKKRRNTKTNGTDGQSSVSKEGDGSAEINKIKSDGNNKSLL